jgi:hypothetical protein
MIVQVISRNGKEQEINEQESGQEDEIILTFLRGLMDIKREELKRLNI